MIKQLAKICDPDLIQAVCWAIILLLIANITLRLFAHDAVMVLLWVNSLTTFLYLPAYPISLYSLLKRNLPLAVLASLVIIFHIYSVQSYFSYSKYPSRLDSTIRLMSANLFAYSSETDEIVKEIERISPDILAMQEYTSNWHDAFIKADFFKKWPFSYYVKRDDTFGSAILSRLRIIQADTFYVDDLAIPQLRASIEFNGRIITLINVHLLPPGIKHYSVHVEQQHRLLQLLKQYSNSDFIIAGDFNVTEHSRFYLKILKNCSNTFDLGGTGLGTTWPNFSFLFPLLRIDHVFLSRRLSCQNVVTGLGRGSDHRPIIATIGF
jgi:endonuclease/exonuclease/phosphatase (EEP) superfamily protein YafD